MHITTDSLCTIQVPLDQVDLYTLLLLHKLAHTTVTNSFPDEVINVIRMQDTMASMHPMCSLDNIPGGPGHSPK
jgi:hypothetical protein